MEGERLGQCEVELLDGVSLRRGGKKEMAMAKK